MNTKYAEQTQKQAGTEGAEKHRRLRTQRRNRESSWGEKKRRGKQIRKNREVRQDKCRQQT